jgi:hypothetical protein
MAYSKVEINGDEASPCFRPFGIENRQMFTYMFFTVGFI